MLARSARIAKLAIPPAYEDVWICTSPRGHLQATGRDARGRKQYRYHPAFRSARDDHKHSRMWSFGKALRSLRASVRRDLKRPGLPREKVLALVVKLLDDTQVRVGNAEYARSNGSFGLTTLRDRHARFPRAARRCCSSAARVAPSTMCSSMTRGSRSSCAAVRNCPARRCSSTWTSRAVGTPSIRAR